MYFFVKYKIIHLGDGDFYFLNSTRINYNDTIYLANNSATRIEEFPVLLNGVILLVDGEEENVTEMFSTENRDGAINGRQQEAQILSSHHLNASILYGDETGIIDIYDGTDHLPWQLPDSCDRCKPTVAATDFSVVVSMGKHNQNVLKKRSYETL